MKQLEERNTPEVTGGALASPYPVTDCPGPYNPNGPGPDVPDPLLQSTYDGLNKSVE